MDADELARDILIAWIHSSKEKDIIKVCRAYKRTLKAVLPADGASKQSKKKGGSKYGGQD
jgi:hypothetical protein